MSDSDTAQMEEDAPAPPEPLRLIARIDGEEVGRLTISEGSASIGRAPESDLVIDHPTVSLRHLQVHFTRGRLLVKDLDTTNGTRYQGSRIHEVLLPADSVLKLGSAELRVERASRAQAVSAGNLTSTAPAMQRALQHLAKVAPGDATVLITGETGSGKEMAASTLHQLSPRASGPFQVVDCGALSPTLAAAELFGHVKGAFTSADRDRAGAFELARGGTVFLDEIGELPLDLQPLLLRALERREIRRVGEMNYRSIDVRLVAATHRDLGAEVLAGRFRSDLLHRLAVVEIRLPPLRERLEDIPDLVRSMLESMGPRAAGFTPSPDLLRALAEYQWPGNVRELRNLIERAVALAGQGGVDLQALGLKTGESDPHTTDYRSARTQALNAFERNFVLQLLKASGKNISRAARDAGIDRVYLHRLMKKHGIEADDL